MDASCACGAVKFTIPTPTPTLIYHCHCIDCRKQSASAFGTSAIFPFFSIEGNDSVSFFRRTCDSGRKQKCYFCNQCGCRLLHAHVLETGNPERVAVKGGILDGDLDWSSAQHIFCRSAVVPIPEGVVRFEAEPTFATTQK